MRGGQRGGGEGWTEGRGEGVTEGRGSQRGGGHRGEGVTAGDVPNAPWRSVGQPSNQTGLPVGPDLLTTGRGPGIRRGHTPPAPVSTTPGPHPGQSLSLIGRDEL